MRPGAYFLNTSRAEVVDQDGVGAARSGKRASAPAWTSSRRSRPAGTGAFEDEIAQVIYGTHHIGASTDQAQEAIAAETVRIVRTFKETGKVPNVVNLARRPLRRAR